MTIDVIGQKLVINDKQTIVSKSQEFVEFKFNLSDEWKDLLTFVQFKQGEDSYNVYLDEDNKCFLPSEIKDGTMTVTLCGSKDDVFATSSSLGFVVRRCELTEDGKSTVITQTLYEQLVNRIEWGNALGIDHIETATSEEDEGENIVTFFFTDDTEKTFTVRNGSKGERGDTGAQGEQGVKGDKGDTGAQGIQGEKGEQGLQGEKGDKGDTGERGSDGADGKDGVDGQDGYSPTVAVSKTDGVTTVTITDKDGTKTAEIKDGEKGDKGDKGDTGAQGAKGDKGDKGDTAEVTVDTALDDTSTNPVTNAAIASAINAKANIANPVFTESISMGRRSGYKVGTLSTAEGDNVVASGNYSHAEGSNTVAGGNASHAEGVNTIASGYYSHAEGYYTTATGYYSHAEGFYASTSSNFQHVQGKFNAVDTAGKYAHIVGGGTSESTRKNIHTLDWNGNTYYSGDGTFTIGGTEYTISAIINAIKALGGTFE